MKKLVAYFSATGTTKKAAIDLAKTINANLYEIEAKEKYTSADLDWTNKNSRSSIEMKDKTSRPELANNDAHIEDYDVIYVGYPVWWYTAPTIINSFLETYDFSNKKIVLFITSGGSSFGSAINDLKSSVPSSCEIIEGKKLNRYSKEDLIGW